MKNPPEKTCYILDGYALIYRSYFALIRNPLINKKGDNVSAVHGFFKEIFRLREQARCAFFLVALDSLGPTFRHQKYQDYKAGRQKTPDELKRQIPVIENILESLSVPVLRVEGFEADDIIGTAAAALAGEAEGSEVKIISGDKDLLQLVSPQISLLRPGKKAGSLSLDSTGLYEEITPGNLKEAYGVRADQVIDYLALIGDTADNIPGAAGIGPKTAQKLLEQYQNLETLYHSLDELPAGQRKKLEEGRESVLFSKDLVRLRLDVPLQASWEAFSLSRFSREKADPLFREEGLSSLTSDGGKENRETYRTRGSSFEAVLSLEQLENRIRQAEEAGEFAFDCETDALDPMQANPVGFSLSCGEKEACYIPLKAPDTVCLAEDEVREALRPLFLNPALKVIGQNFKYDMKVLSRWGLSVENFYFDTMIAARLLESHLPSGMDALAKRHLFYQTISFSETVSKGQSFQDVPTDKAVPYAAEDAEVTFRLYKFFKPLLKEEKLEELFYTVEMPLCHTLTRMELEGIHLDPRPLKVFEKELLTQMSRVEKEVFELCGREFNLNSPKQLEEILFEERGLKPVKKNKTGYSTDSAVLTILAPLDPVPEKLLRYRTLAKLHSGYVKSLPGMIHPESGRIHTNFLQTGAATGRLACKDPNLQNIPIRDENGRRIRRAFRARPGSSFLSADYSQIELVVLAHTASDPGLIRAFQNKEDIHRMTAARIFRVFPELVTDRQRSFAKTINFGIIYGMSAFRLARETGITQKEARAFIDSYFEAYPKIKDFIRASGEEALRHGCVRTLAGRKRLIPGIDSKNKTEQQKAERVAVNTKIQGSAADIMKIAMLKIEEAVKKEHLTAKILLQVHDECVLEAPDEEIEQLGEIVRRSMESAVTLSVPLRVEISSGKDWGSIH